MRMPIMNVNQGMNRIKEYLLDDRPLNLDEMRELVQLWDQFKKPMNHIYGLENANQLPNLKHWTVQSDWNKVKTTLGYPLV